MNTVKKLSKSIGKALLSAALVIYTSSAAFAIDIADSDLSNNAGTNKNWLNSFWFFICVSLLIAVAVIGSRNKYHKIRRDYPGPGVDKKH